jgi:hypothetical protein
MRLKLDSRRLRMVTAAALGVTGLFALPSAALADNGDRTTVRYCEDLDAQGHAKTRFCSVTWGKNIRDGSYWQIVSMQLLDSMTDGYCARGTFSDGGSLVEFSECNGNWYSRTQRFDGRTARIAIGAKAGLRNGIWQWSDYTTLDAPSSF